MSRKKQPKQQQPTYTFDELLDRIPLMDMEGLQIMERLIMEEADFYPTMEWATITYVLDLCYKEQMSKRW